MVGANIPKTKNGEHSLLETTCSSSSDSYDTLLTGLPLLPGPLQKANPTRRKEVATRKASSTDDPPNNNDDINANHWTKLGTMSTLSTPWMTLVGERLLDNHGTELEYWRVEKEDSAVILTMQGNDLIFPKQNVYRPGVGERTLDFPGGRVCHGKRPIDVVPVILERELGIHASKDIIAIQPLNQNNSSGWPINSSFSNQRLFGFCATIDPNAMLEESSIRRCGSGPEDVENLLLEELSCLQCRSVLLEWLRRREPPHRIQ